jgi:argininosuccinate synthase
LKLYKGNVISLGKESTNSLYDENKASFEEQGGFSNEDMKNHIERNILDFDA